VLPLTGAERKKYLVELEKKKNSDGYVLSDPAGAQQRKLKRKDLATKNDIETGEVEMENLETARGGATASQDGSPQPKKVKTGKGVDTGTTCPSASSGEKDIDVGVLPKMLKRRSRFGILSLIFEGMVIFFCFGVFLKILFIHLFVYFCRYMEEQVPLAPIDVDAV